MTAKNGKDAARQYVDGGDWGEIDKTTWIRVHVWQEEPDADGEIVRSNEETHKIRLDPPEPSCLDDGGHDWQAPHSIVGGIRENPGVFGHGGGVIMEEVCMRCGCGRSRDTWAQDPNDGQQGLTSISYVPGKYAEALPQSEV